MTDVVQFWTESGFTIWTRNTRDIVISRGLDELESARALAVLGLAGGEGMLACWDAKYHYMNWRPFQAIQRADEEETRTRTPSRLGAAVRANHPDSRRLRPLRRGDGHRLRKVFGGDSRSRSPAPGTRYWGTWGADAKLRLPTRSSTTPRTPSSGAASTSARRWTPRRAGPRSSSAALEGRFERIRDHDHCR
jgi:hypothetical protein